MDQIFVPAGRTSEYQPLDVGVNKSMKVYFREEYQSWRKAHHDVTKSGYLKKPSRQDFLNMIWVAWAKVPADVIRKSFFAAKVFDPEVEQENLCNESDLDGDLEISSFSDSLLVGFEDGETGNGLPL